MINHIFRKLTPGRDKVLIGVSVGFGCVIPVILCLIPVLFVLGTIVEFMRPPTQEGIEFDGQETIGYDIRDVKTYFRKNHRFDSGRETFRGSDAPWSSSYRMFFEVLEGQDQSLVMIYAVPEPTNEIAIRSYIAAVRAVGKPKNAKFETLICRTPKPSKGIKPFRLPAKPTQPLICPKGTIAVPKPLPEPD